MKYPKTIWVICLLAVCLNSCIKLTERIHFNKDGSGSYYFELDLGGLGKTMDTFGNDERKGELFKILEGFSSRIEELNSRMNTVNGLSNVEVSYDSTIYITKFGFDFTGVPALNEGLETLYAIGPANGAQPFFTASKKRLTRNNRDPFTKLILQNDLLEEAEMEMLSIVLRELHIESTLSFEGTVRKYSNKDYRKQDDQSLRWIKYIFSTRDEDKSLANTIDLKGMKFAKRK